MLQAICCQQCNGSARTSTVFCIVHDSTAQHSTAQHSTAQDSLCMYDAVSAAGMPGSNVRFASCGGPSDE